MPDGKRKEFPLAVIPAEAGIQKRKCYYGCMDKSIFRAYDIRGIYPTELDEQDAYKIARAIFEYSKCQKVAVGRDARLSAPQIHKAVCQGFLDAGCEVTDCGMASSDMMAWAAGAKDFDITINVTASHNPKEWIGLKINQRGGGTVGGAGEIETIFDIVKNRNFQFPISNFQLAGVKKLDLLPDWIKHVLSFVDVAKIKPMKIIVDAGNGVAGPIVRELFKHLPVELVEMYFKPDGNFPNHLPSPIEPQNTADLQRKVVEVNADLGMAFDGDADRVFLIDDNGRWVNGSEMTALIIDKVLSENSKRVVLYNAICGWNVYDVIKKYNAKSYRTKVGHGYIKKDMRRHKAYFAGEHSGHYFFKDNFCADSGLIAAVLVLALLSEKKKTLSELLAPHRRYASIAEMNFRVGDIEKIFGALEKKYAGLDIDKLDGLTVSSKDWWCNVRPSSNEPLLRLNLEAKDKTILDKMKQELTNLITKPTQISA